MYAPRRFTQPGLSISGTYWDDGRLFNGISEDGVVSADRETIRWQFLPIVPDVLRLFYLEWHVIDFGAPDKQLTVKAFISHFSIIAPYQYTSFWLGNVDGTFPLYDSAGWRQGDNVIPPPLFTPAYPYSIQPAYWEDYPVPYVDP
jgi:hypothetical protein